jgi:uncharacterized protein YoaH (UPF0181 family)
MSAVRTLFLTAALITAPALAQDATPAPAPAPAANNADIVVTARSLEDTARALRECLARNCPPAEDIRATLAHAENQFVTGDYTNARSTMTASIRRNRNAGGEAPIELSDLYRANGRVAAHLGESRAFQLSTLNMRDTLRENLPEGDARILAAEIEVADSRRALGYVDEARDSYARIARVATERNAPRVAAFARIRQATVDLPPSTASASIRNSRVAREAVASLEQVMTMGATAGQDIALLAETLLARYDRDNGSMARTEALMRRFAAGGGASRPLLISGQPVRLHGDQGPERDRQANSALNRLQMSDVTDRWLDVGFWVEVDGTVGEVEILRSEGDRSWFSAVERSIKSRRYSPLRRTASDTTPGFYIVERFTLTAQIRTDCTGTRIACRDPNPRIERIDLTPDDI